MDTLQAYRAFLRVAETASFSRTAEDMSLQQSQVSRMVAGLEAQLGVQLLRRTTRSVTVTEEGERFRGQLATILSALEECQDEIRNRRVEPVGLIRVACPTTLGRVVVAPIIDDFLARFPQTRIEMIMSNKLANLAADGIDVAIRVGRIPESEHPSRMIGYVDQRLVASSGYVGRHGMVADPAELVDRNCLCFASGGGAQTWTFQRGEARRSVRVKGDFIANDAETLMHRCASGHGVAVLPGWLLKSGDTDDLVELMPGWRVPSMPLNLVCAHRNHRPLKIRTLLEFLRTQLRPFMLSHAEAVLRPQDRGE
ncbi:LysR family transcriptional regulator [Phreatobacter sp. AB_2022a]|uniref:LysR family transcriptional regulator n=1 Tax=Phreatobacter sp. AB_2022a TaxID=3003134 RepID=UPI002286DB46|nr:LysR family transcriptional regulator [Phreatobacter sp. AB_2022a]MCZ0734683.1 LysR substrate-binding domain-containing protein [Phreatobacter sp. AB_2022a]